jgi:DNA excision repair protein ERCC-8
VRLTRHPSAKLLRLSSLRVRCEHRAPVCELDVERVEARYLLSCGADARVSLYDVRATLPAEAGRRRRGRARGGAVGAAEADAEAEASEEGRERGGDGAGGGAAREARPVLPCARWRSAHRFAVNSVQWYPVDTGMFVSGDMSGCVRVWDTNRFAAAHDFRIESAANQVALSRCATAHHLVAVACAGGAVRLCDIASGGCTHALEGHRREAMGVSWSPLSEFQLASCSLDRTVRVWDIRRAGCLMVLDRLNGESPLLDARFADPRNRLKERSLESHGDGVAAVRFTPDGALLVSSGLDGRLVVWDATTGRNTLLALPQHRNVSRWHRFAFSLDGALLFMPSDSGVLVLSLRSGRLVRDLRGHYDAVRCVACSTLGGETLFSGGADTSILAWEPRAQAAVEPAGPARRSAADGDAWSDEEEAGGPAEV